MRFSIGSDPTLNSVQISNVRLLVL